uniref:MATH domain-containing protein n=2 Tax=Caenorhabditis tropicalis TaxID=1561998 RepID=A0A1I7V2P5_9PELO
MFMVTKPSFGTGCFASASSCQSEYNGKIESDAVGAAAQQKSSIAGLKGSLRRNSSNLSQDLAASQPEICHADATNIEINCSTSASRAFYVRVEVPTGEQGLIHFSAASEPTQVFTPLQTGCGHGIWKFVVCTMENGSEIAHSQVSRNLDGVGLLYFNVFDDLEIRLTQQEFLHISHCHTRRH